MSSNLAEGDSCPSCHQGNLLRSLITGERYCPECKFSGPTVKWICLVCNKACTSPTEYCSVECLDKAAKRSFTPETLRRFHRELCTSALCLMEKKNNDYASAYSNNVFANFTSSATLTGIDEVLGIVQRICDKLSRVRTYVETGTLLVKDEGMENVALDLINYTVLMMAFIEEKKRLASR